VLGSRRTDRTRWSGRPNAPEPASGPPDATTCPRFKPAPPDLNGQVTQRQWLSEDQTRPREDRTQPSSRPLMPLARHDWTHSQRDRTGHSNTWSSITSSKHPEPVFDDRTCLLVHDRTQAESGPFFARTPAHVSSDRTHPLRIRSFLFASV
jgi:hypothetical protein